MGQSKTDIRSDVAINYGPNMLHYIQVRSAARNCNMIVCLQPGMVTLDV